jgi:hypothetical protein
MFQRRTSSGPFSATLAVLELIYHNTARQVRKQHGNAVIAVLVSILQSVAMVAVFYIMFSMLGLRGAAIRGDFLLYIMSGVFLFFTHIKAIQAVYGSEGPASPMMQHLPMTTAIAIASSALSALYTQFLTVIVILAIYQLGWGAVTIYNPVGAAGMLILAWFSGAAIGMLFLGLKPWAPGLARRPADDLHAGEHDCVGKDVRGQRHAGLHGRAVHLEPALSHHRPGAGVRLHQLQPALHLDQLSDLCLSGCDDDRSHG